MTDPIFWPDQILKPQTVSVDIAHRNLRSPSASNGFTQVVSNSFGLWRVTYSDIPVYTKEMIKLWRAIDTLAEGSLRPLSIPVYELPRSPGSKDDYGSNVANIVKTSTPHSDSSFFDDGSGYRSSYANVITSAVSLVGMTTISVLKFAPNVILEPGQRFSINDRLYQIRTIITQTTTNATFTVRPPIRENIQLASHCEFDLPRVRVRLLSDTAMYLPLNFNQQSFPPLDFIEDL